MTKKIEMLFLTLAIALFFRLPLAQGQLSCTTPEAITTSIMEVYPGTTVHAELQGAKAQHVMNEVAKIAQDTPVDTDYAIVFTHPKKTTYFAFFFKDGCYNMARALIRHDDYDKMSSEPPI